MRGLGPRRPWGFYRALLREPGVQVKRIEVKPGKRFSLQKHFKRDEHWIVIAGRGRATLGTRVLGVKPGAMLKIPRRTAHRLWNTGRKPLVIIEVQLGNYLGEDDIQRLKDDFGRIG